MRINTLGWVAATKAFCHTMELVQGGTNVGVDVCGIYRILSYRILRPMDKGLASLMALK